ncbi:MAG: alpha/beta hydrolase [Cryomorphaceae bacterium]|nr:alpha/beta hydrolase [Cryomorphaceae bacterium]
MHHIIYRTDDPNAPWLVFVHGAGGSSTVWFKQLRAFRDKKHNVLMLDLRGHGGSVFFRDWMKKDAHDFTEVCKDVVEVLEYHHIPPAHMIGISLGTLVIRKIAEDYPERVKSLIMGGAIVKFNIRSRLLVWLVHRIKRLLPFIWIYKIYAFILMPKKRHRKSRNLFIRQAKKLYHKEFLRWITITRQLKPIMKFFRENDTTHPVLYIMGDEDYMFLPSVKLVASKHSNARLVIVPDSGHVVNVDQPRYFNKLVKAFVAGQ